MSFALQFLMVLAAVVGALLVAAALYGRDYRRRVEAAYPPRGRLVETRAGVLHVIETGNPEGAPVILVHGAVSSARDISYALTPVLSQHRVLAVDRPGFGWSPPTRAKNRLDAHARAVKALIDAEGLERPVIVGHSYGAAVALKLGLRHADRLGAIVVLGPASQSYVGPAAWYNYAGAAPIIGPILNACVAPILGPLRVRGGADAAFEPQTAPPGYMETVGLALFFRPHTFASNARDLARINRELVRQDRHYDQITTPMAVIAGDADPTVYTHRHAEPLARAAPNATLTLLPGVGHMPHYVDPHLVAECVDALVERRGQGPSDA